MNKDGLVKTVQGLRQLVFFMMVLIIGVGVTIMMDWAGDAHVKVGVEAADETVEDEADTDVTHQCQNPKELAAATISDCASMEADRIAKMAAILMGIGGEYTATCKATYNPSTDKAGAWYSLTWYRMPGNKVGNGVFVAEDEKPIKKTWAGSSWAECLDKMRAWKGGE